MPLVINCWPTQTGGDAWEVSVEYELATAAYPQLEVHNLTVTIPTPVDSPPSINASAGAASYSRRDNAVTWTVPFIDSSVSSGTVELQLTGVPSADALYPISVDFAGAATLCAVSVSEVRSADGSGATLPFAASASLAVDSYTIQ